MTLGGPPVWDEPGGLSRCSTARRLAEMAGGRMMSTRTSQKPGSTLMTPGAATQNTHNNTMPIDSAVLARTSPETVRFG